MNLQRYVEHREVMDAVRSRLGQYRSRRTVREAGSSVSVWVHNGALQVDVEYTGGMDAEDSVIDKLLVQNGMFPREKIKRHATTWKERGDVKYIYELTFTIKKYKP